MQVFYALSLVVVLFLWGAIWTDTYPSYPNTYLSKVECDSGRTFSFGDYIFYSSGIGTDSYQRVENQTKLKSLCSTGSLSPRVMGQLVASDLLSDDFGSFSDSTDYSVNLVYDPSSTIWALWGLGSLGVIAIIFLLARAAFIYIVIGKRS